MMSELRWILVGFGIVLLAAIYLWGRRSNRAVATDDAVLRARPEPSVHNHSVHNPSVQNIEPTLIRAVDDGADAPNIVPPDDPPPLEHDSSAIHDTWRGRLEPTFADAA